MGFEDKVEQSFTRPCCSDERQGQADMRSHLIIVPRGTSFHGSVELEFSSYRIRFCMVFMLLLSCCCCGWFPSPVPSTHMRCMITASRRAKATIAFFIPRRLAICMAQALSQDHFFECNMLCAAS